MLRRLLLRAYRVPDRPDPPDPATLGLVAEDLDLRAVDGARLRGWFVPCPDDTEAGTAGEPRPAVVLVHGWGSSSGDLLPAVPGLLAAGFGVALLDARSHGRSDRVEFMSMPRFAEDVEAVVAWLRADARLDADRIALIGHSVGAGASLLVGARDPRVRAVVSIASMAHPAELIERTLGRRLPAAALAAARRTVEATIGARLDDIAPLATIRRQRAPVLLLHGLDDTTVPALDAMRLADAATAAGVTAMLRLIPGADHRTIDAFLPATAEAAHFLAAAVDGEVHQVPTARRDASTPDVA